VLVASRMPEGLVAQMTDASSQFGDADDADQCGQPLHAPVESIGPGQEMKMGQVVLGQGRELDLGEIVRGEWSDRAVLDPVLDAGQVIYQRVGVGWWVDRSHGSQGCEDQQHHHYPDPVFSAQGAETIPDPEPATPAGSDSPSPTGDLRCRGEQQKDDHHDPCNGHRPRGEVVADACHFGDGQEQHLEGEVGEDECPSNRQVAKSDAVPVRSEQEPE
jgi:hypothetical protein